jgi:hypothetical protein
LDGSRLGGFAEIAGFTEKRWEKKEAGSDLNRYSATLSEEPEDGRPGSR